MKEPDPFVCLKLDVVKTFDSVEWVFIERMLDKMGFGNFLIDFFRSITSIASLAILLNGRIASAFNITRSV